MWRFVVGHLLRPCTVHFVLSTMFGRSNQGLRAPTWSSCIWEVAGLMQRGVPAGPQAAGNHPLIAPSCRFTSCPYPIAPLNVTT
jgi:hypothetical protein